MIMDNFRIVGKLIQLVAQRLSICYKSTVLSECAPQRFCLLARFVSSSLQYVSDCGCVHTMGDETQIFWCTSVQLRIL